MQSLLEVKNLRTHFHTRGGVVKAVDGVTFNIQEGETLGVVGESGSGKSVTALSVMRLVASPPGNILEMTEDELHEMRGGKISMIFQDPMTSLNPVFTVGFQISESVKTHLKLNNRDAAAHT